MLKRSIFQVELQLFMLGKINVFTGIDVDILEHINDSKLMATGVFHILTTN